MKATGGTVFKRHISALDRLGGTLSLRPLHPELDEVILSQIRGQSGQAGVVHTGLQLGQLLEKTGLARADEALVVDQPSNQDDQDRRAVGAPCQEVGIPAC